MHNAQAHTKKLEKSTFHSYVKFSSDSSNEIGYSHSTSVYIVHYVAKVVAEEEKKEGNLDQRTIPVKYNIK